MDDEEDITRFPEDDDPETLMGDWATDATEVAE